MLAAKVKIKYRAKCELYNFLSKNLNYYLPVHRAMTIYWMKDLMAGRKKGKLHRSISYRTRLFSGIKST